ncbi:hypothetical protein JSR02_00190 [Candidatus Vidania fulgoroideae]|uniref:indole-3-glycerol-phosphate synthase n=1 Tax=Candidatus Vidania fulgoroideorum TaxID=881286 RepID=A0A974XDV0_9PROT|nr:hypothetical protein JSR02_00190 [Candidatus Vidania fulgoroideae]
MLFIIRNRLCESFFFTFRVFINRLVYAAFFAIVPYRPCFLFCYALFAYRSVIFERKFHSPLEGYKFNSSIFVFITFLPYSIDCLSILIDRKHFRGSAFECLRFHALKFLPFTLFKDFMVPVPGYCYYFNLGVSFVLVVCSMYSHCLIFNIVKYFKFWGFNVILEISSWNVLEQLVVYGLIRNLFIGFNTRDLFSFRVLSFYSNVYLYGYIYESGILSLNSLIKVRNLGFKVCLIGGGFANKCFFVL